MEHTTMNELRWRERRMYLVMAVMAILSMFGEVVPVTIRKDGVSIEAVEIRFGDAVALTLSTEFIRAVSKMASNS